MKYYELMYLTRQLILLGECVFANLKLRNTYNVIGAGNMPFWHRVPKMKYSLTHVMDINIQRGWKSVVTLWSLEMASNASSMLS